MKNRLSLRRLFSVMVLALAFLRPAVEYIAANEIIRNLRIEPSLSLPSPFRAETILISLLFLILAQVWSYGLELRRDQALTI